MSNILNRMQRLFFICIGLLGIAFVLYSCDGNDGNGSDNSIFEVKEPPPSLEKIIVQKVYVTKETDKPDIPENRTPIATYLDGEDFTCPSDSEVASDSSDSLYFLITQYIGNVEDSSYCVNGLVEGINVYIQYIDGSIHELIDILSEEEQFWSMTVTNAALDIINNNNAKYCVVASIKINDPSEVQKIGFRIEDEDGNSSDLEWVCFESMN